MQVLIHVEMELKKLHMGTVVFGFDSMDEVAALLVEHNDDNDNENNRKSSYSAGFTGLRSRRDMGSRVRDAVLALATCHNVSCISTRVAIHKGKRSSKSNNKGHARAK